MKRTFFLSGVEKLIIRHMVVGSATMTEAVESKGKLAAGFLWAVCTALTLLTYAIHVASGEQMGQGWERRGNRGWDLVAAPVSLSFRMTWSHVACENNK